MTEVRPTRILVIDDEVTQRMLVREYLEEAGYQVRLSEDGEHGVKIATAITPDLIIVDALLPGMDGYTVCSTLRQRTKTADVPIILMTASKEADAIAKGFAAGATDFITKPVEWRFLADRVAYVLEKSRHMQSLHAEKSSIEEELRLTSERQGQAHDTAITREDLERIRAELLEEARVAREEAEVRVREAEDAADTRLRVSQSAYEQQLESLRSEVSTLENELNSAKAGRAEDAASARAELEDALRKARASSESGLSATVSAYESRIRGLEAKMQASMVELERTHAAHLEEMKTVRAQADEAIRAAQTNADTRLAVATAIREEDLRTAEAANQSDAADHQEDAAQKKSVLWTFLKTAHAAELSIMRGLQSGLDNITSDIPNSKSDGLRPALGRLQGQVKELVSLTQKTNVFAQSLLDQSQLVESEFDVVAQLKKIVARAMPACVDRGLDLRADYSVDRLSVRADETKINFVLNSFLANAVRFTPAGGALVYSIEREPTGGLRISLTDNGVGINSNLIERLRSSLDRPDLIQPSQDRKLGLSLAIAMAIARQHGGQIEIDSIVGEGTAISLVLPAERTTGSELDSIRDVGAESRLA